MEAHGLAQAIERVRALAAREAEGILDEALGRMSRPEADLREIERRIREQVLRLGGQLLEQALRVNGRGYEGARRGCSCGGRQAFVSYRPKRLTTLLSEVTLERAYYHCSQCGRGAIPLDHRWDVGRTGFSPALREAVAWLSAEVSFERTRGLLERLCGISISKERVEQIAEGYGEQLEEYEKEADDRTPRPKGVDESEDLYIEVDGTTVHLHEGWKEVKLGSIFRARVPSEEEKPIRGPTTHLGGFVDAERLGQQVWEKVDRMHPESARRQIVLGDGAHWIWNQAELHFPEAIQIVDWYHATEHVWEVARAVYGENSSRVRPWAQQREEELAKGDVEALLRALAQIRPRSRKARKVVENTKGYFQNHRERMRYDRFRQEGLFIGSGVVEAGCKHVVGERLKKAGMRWSKPGATKILNLRLCILNNQWENFWQWRRSRLQDAA